MGNCKKATVEGFDKLRGMTFDELMAMSDEVEQEDADGRDGALDELLNKAIEEFAHNRGLDIIIDCKVCMASDGLQLSVGGSNAVRDFFEDMEGFDEVIARYAEQFARVGHEFIQEFSTLMVAYGYAEADEDGDDM